MSPRTRVILFSILLTAPFAGASRAQDVDQIRQRQLEEAIQEKLHPPVSPEQDVLKSSTNSKKGRHSAESVTQKPVENLPPESEIHAAINPTDSNNLVVSAMHLGGGTLTMPIYYSTNFGNTWTKSTFQMRPYESGAQVGGGGDPLFAYDANGKLYVSWIDLYSLNSNLYAGMFWASSTDGGKTWTRSTSATTAGYIGKSLLSGGVTGFDDKEWMTVDRTNSPYHNTLYVAWTHLGTNSYGVMLRRKLPGIDSFEIAAHVSTGAFKTVQFTSIGVDADGGVHVTFMGTLDTMHYALYHAYSADGGKTFQPQVKVADADIPASSYDAKDASIFGIRQNGNYPCPHLSIDTANSGNLYMVWNALGVTSNLGHGTDIYFSKSTDNGKTWSAPTTVNDDGVGGTTYIDHFYPSIAVNGQGRITATWYDRREDENNQIGRYYMAQSADQGTTWKNAPVASQPMDFNNVMDQNTNFGIGEYTQVLTTPNYTIPFWTDGRANDGNLHIYTAFIPQGTDPLASSGITRISTVSEGIELLANYPNPVSSTTHVGFRFNTSAHATLSVLNLLGQHVATIYDGTATAGEHDFTFDASRLPNGTYYLDLDSDLGTARRAITIAR